MTMQVLVTGAGGLIGRKVVELLSQSCHPIALVRSKDAAPAGAEFIVADLADPGFAKHLPARVDAVVHLAQASGFANFPDDAPSVFRVNLGALAELLAWSAGAGVKNFVHASTGGLYGRGPHPFHEEAPARIDGPLAFYLGTKCAAELLAKPYSSRFNVTALRYFFVYGPGQRETMLVPRLVKSISNGQPIRLAGQDGMRFNPIFVDDAAKATIAAVQLDECAIVNVAGAEVVSLREFAGIIGESVNATPLFELSGEPDGNDLVADISRMRARLHVPGTGLREGISRLIDATIAPSQEGRAGVRA